MFKKWFINIIINYLWIDVDLIYIENCNDIFFIFHTLLLKKKEEEIRNLNYLYDFW